MREGTLVYDERSRRMDVRFGLEDYYGGLHCGTALDVLLDNQWYSTRIELDDEWYLVGVKTASLAGLRVRI